MKKYLWILPIFLWSLTIIGAVFGGLTAHSGIVHATAAMGRGNAAAVGIFYTVVPYCLARAVSEIVKR